MTDSWFPFNFEPDVPGCKGAIARPTVSELDRFTATLAGMDTSQIPVAEAHLEAIAGLRGAPTRAQIDRLPMRDVQAFVDAITEAVKALFPSDLKAAASPVRPNRQQRREQQRRQRRGR